FDPGLSWDAEVLTVTGDYTQMAGATLELNLLNPGEYDRLVVEGVANLAGTLEVSLAEGATMPQAGDTFDLLDFASATGAFDTIMLPALLPGLTWNTSELTTTGAVSVAAALAGDFDMDG